VISVEGRILGAKEMRRGKAFMIFRGREGEDWACAKKSRQPEGVPSGEGGGGSRIFGSLDHRHLSKEGEGGFGLLRRRNWKGEFLSVAKQPLVEDGKRGPSTGGGCPKKRK